MCRSAFYNIRKEKHTGLGTAYMQKYGDPEYEMEDTRALENWEACTMKIL